MEYRKLTINEKEELRIHHKKERDGRVRDRIKAVLMYDDGYSFAEIAKVLLLSDEGIRKHLIDYHGQAKLKPENGGNYSKLNTDQEQQLIEHLETNSYVYARDIGLYIEKQYGVSYTLAGVIKLLHRLGFSYKKPKLIPGKLDLAKQEEFKLQYSLLKGNLAKDEAIYFMDSVHPQYQTRAKYGWIRKNQVKTLPTFSGWKRKHIIGAINLESHDLITTDNPKVNGDYIIEFLKKLEEHRQDKRKIYLICDNAGYHKSNKIKEYLKNSKIELIFLPPYSPNLNPIERMWKFMHSVVSNNRFYLDFASFANSLQSFFDNISKYKHKISSLINDNFQTIIPNHFANSLS
jgi:transposase